LDKTEEHQRVFVDVCVNALDLLLGNQLVHSWLCGLVIAKVMREQQ